MISVSEVHFNFKISVIVILFFYVIYLMWYISLNASGQ